MHAAYTDAAGNRYQPVGRMPYCELNHGDAFALQNCNPRVFFRGRAGVPALNGSLGDVVRRAYNGLVVALIRVG